MENFFQKMLDSNFSDLPGLVADISIPMPEYLVNELLAAILLGNKSITSCQAAIGIQNQVVIELKTNLWPWPVKLKLKLEEQSDWRGTPNITAWLENHVWLANAGSLFSLLPPSVSIQGKQITVDLNRLLSTPEQTRILKLIKTVVIKTDEGLLTFMIKAGVDGKKE